MTYLSMLRAMIVFLFKLHESTLLGKRIESMVCIMPSKILKNV
ncbi:hypothetical protein VCHA53O466_50436 [Vibrio chagasii]|nr:hypothetical protein VCHA53O466_50436 [Vibrio chagasii]